jgi:hypothetical protein
MHAGLSYDVVDINRPGLDRIDCETTTWGLILHPTRIHPQRRPVPHIPVEIHIAGGEADRVFAEEPVGAGVVPAGAVEVAADRGVPFPAGVGEPGLELAVRLADNLAERVVADVVDYRGGAGGGVVLDQVADGAEVVAEAPGDDPRGAGGGRGLSAGTSKPATRGRPKTSQRIGMKRGGFGLVDL